MQLNAQQLSSLVNVEANLIHTKYFQNQSAAGDIIQQIKKRKPNKDKKNDIFAVTIFVPIIHT